MTRCAHCKRRMDDLERSMAIDLLDELQAHPVRVCFGCAAYIQTNMPAAPFAVQADRIEIAKIAITQPPPLESL